MRFDAFMWPKAPNTGEPSTSHGSTAGTGHAGIGTLLDGSVVPVVPRPPLDEVGMDDETRRQLEHLAAERKVLGPRIPERRDATVDHAQGQEPPGDTGVAFHRREVAADGPCDRASAPQQDGAGRSRGARRRRGGAGAVPGSSRGPSGRYPCDRARRRRSRSSHEARSRRRGVCEARERGARSSRRCPSVPAASGCSTQLSLALAVARLALQQPVDQLQQRRVEHALLVHERLDVPAQQRAKQLLHRVDEALLSAPGAA